jgi:leucyl/phenylalanyl-tRNA---protein transferase
VRSGLRGVTPEFVLGAYAVGMFPMADDYHGRTIHWVEPRRRGVIPLDGFHVPRSLAKAIRRGGHEVRVDTAFAAVIRACAEPTPDRPKTWLNEELIELYVELHRRGHAHSVETWRDGRLVGGLYGLELGGAFFGESMFSRARDASKVALVELVARLRAGGFELLDTQFLTEHLQRFGAVEISRAEYLSRLRRALPVAARFPAASRYPSSGAGPGVAGAAGSAGAGTASSSGSSGSAQSITQTS